ncbi:zinc transporter ZupT [Corynebacterium breve]|uniref:Zinc transporter ZupT n=1 Tax=Corynebacterium breve TaxID=3049799 RepID=A0ABY8VHI6_9CORY|nr:zinc transporter ZupT [Corynebacterium breve]WIM68542.1 zinc transporter ZupT [Corynebacterium breve]
MFSLSEILIAFSMTLLAGLATGIGGAIGVIRKEPGSRFTASALGFSAGVMVFVSLVEILPKGTESLVEIWGDKGGAWAGTIAFFAGIALIALIDRLVPEEINPHEPDSFHNADKLASRRARMMKAGMLTAVALALHNFPEGFATFIAALEEPSLAIPIVVAIAIHNIPEGIAVAVPLRAATGSRWKAWGWATLSGLAEPLGALVGFLILMPVMGPAAMGIAFAGVAGIMVFISLDELLPTAKETGEHHASTYGMIAGMAVMAVSLVLLG